MENIVGKVKRMVLKARYTAFDVMVGLGICSCIGFCDVDVNSSTQKVMKAIFNLLLFGGIIMAAVGIGMLVRTVISMSQGEQAQPGALGRAIAITAGGIVLAAMKTITKTSHPVIGC